MKYFNARSKLRDALADPIEPENEHLIARVYWRVLIVCSIGITLAALAYSLGQYQATLQVFDAQTPTSTKASGPFSRTDLDTVISAFDLRAERYQSLRTAPLTEPDPSK